MPIQNKFTCIPNSIFTLVFLFAVNHITVNTRLDFVSNKNDFTIFLLSTVFLFFFIFINVSSDDTSKIIDFFRFLCAHCLFICGKYWLFFCIRIFAFLFRWLQLYSYPCCFWIKIFVDVFFLLIDCFSTKTVYIFTLDLLIARWNFVVTFNNLMRLIANPYCGALKLE